MSKDAWFMIYSRIVNKPTKKPNKGVGARAITSIISVSRQGTGYIRSEFKPDQSIIIEHEDLATALHGDTVNYIVLTPPKSSKPKGRITEILARAKAGFAGTLIQKQNVYLLKADDTRLYVDITIPKDNLGTAKPGDKVFVVLAEWKNMQTNPIGKITKILGAPGSNEAEMSGIAMERGFDSTFSASVVAEVAKIETRGIQPQDYNDRRDMRSTPTFTIDPGDAKDFDDALSIKVLDDQNIEVGIHIADVSFYVRPGTLLDKEAFKRGTSVYLVDRTIPMLPFGLSNDLCSLKPNVDRLAVSTIVTMTPQGKIIDAWYGRTVIHSHKRFTYEDAQSILDAGSGKLFNELTIANTLAKKLLEERKKDGTLVLETEEVKFELDADGVPLRAYRKIRGDTHKLIEEWMLLANKKVAELFMKSEKTGGIGVYRIHDLPDKEKIDDFGYLLAQLGHDLPKGPVKPKTLSDMLEQIAHLPEKDFITSILIRSMAKAIYSTKNIGHFGLGFEDYTHFTSPIRRYPDLMVHRLLLQILAGRPTRQKEQKSFERMALYASEQERSAADAERASVKYKQVEYMSSRIGETYQGIISGITERGIFVEERETKSEGMIQLRDLGDDQFVVADRNTSLVGKRTKKRFRIGDSVTIRVLSVDLIERRIDYVLV